MDLTSLEKLPLVVLKGMEFALILLLTALASKLAKGVIKRTFRSKAPGLTMYAQQYVYWFVWFIGILFGVAQLGLSVEILLLVAGLFGLGLILAVRGPLENIFARPFLDLFGSCKVGDSIQIGEYKGKVMEINPLNTVLIGRRGELIAVPNSMLLRNVLMNTSTSAGLEITIPIVLDKEIDLVEFEREVLKACEDLKKHIKRGTEPSVVTTRTTEELTELSLILVLRDPEEKGLVVSAINEAVKGLVDAMKMKKEREDEQV